MIVYLGASGQAGDVGGFCFREASGRRSDAWDYYLVPHEHHLDYAARLAEGRSIGSGQVEGACQNLIGRRLKQTGARWRTRRVNRMAGLCSIMYSHQGDAYWTSLTS